MAYKPVKTVATGDGWSAQDWNQYIRDNFAAGVPDIFTTKGDLAAATGSDAAERVAVGANDTTLTADSAQTAGAKWAKKPERDLVAAKGDLISGSAADTLAKTTVGSDGSQLVADSGQSGGIAWWPFIGAGGRHNGGSHTVEDSTAKLIELDTEVFDPGNDLASNRFTADRAGYYLVAFFQDWQPFTAVDANERLEIQLYKNGASVSVLSTLVGMATFTGSPAQVGYDLVYLDVNDYVQFYAYQNTGAQRLLQANGRYFVIFIGR